MLNTQEIITYNGEPGACPMFVYVCLCIILAAFTLLTVTIVGGLFLQFIRDAIENAMQVKRWREYLKEKEDEDK